MSVSRVVGKAGLFPAVVSALLSAPATAQVDTLWTQRHEFPWESGFDAVEMAFGPDGSIYQLGQVSCCLDGYYFGVVRYAPDGEEIWAAGPDLGALFPGVSAMSIDAFGNVYAVGIYNVTAKYSSAGELLWTRGYGTGLVASTSSVELPYEFYGDVAVDDSGNAYMLTGDFRTIKYTPQGDTVWSHRYQSPDGTAYGYLITASGSGEVWSTGKLVGAGSNSDVVTIHYSAAGDSLWTQRFDGPASADDLPGAQVLDPAHHLYVAGRATRGSDRVMFVTNYAPAGDTAWVRYYPDAPGPRSQASDIALDTWGNVLVTGGQSAGDSSWFALIRLDPEGNLLREGRTPNTPMGGNAALAVDATGHAYVSADYVGSTWKFSPAGDVVWHYPHHGTDILVDDSGQVYLAARLWIGGHNLVKLSQVDSDSDLVIDPHDNCPSTPNTIQANGDSDSLGDACDNCPQVTNPDQGFAIALTGDIDQSGTRTSSDIILLVNFVFKNGASPLPCVAAGDVNCSGAITSADIVILVNFMFKAGLPPCDVCLQDGPAWSCP